MRKDTVPEDPNKRGPPTDRYGRTAYPSTGRYGQQPPSQAFGNISQIPSDFNDDKPATQSENALLDDTRERIEQSEKKTAANNLTASQEILAIKIAKQSIEELSKGDIIAYARGMHCNLSIAKAELEDQCLYKARLDVAGIIVSSTF